MLIRRLEQTDENIGRLWAKFWEHRHQFPLGTGDSLDRFIPWACSPNTVIHELDDFGGVVYWTGIFKPPPPDMGEASAYLHVFIWDRKVFGKWRDLRKARAWFLDDVGIDRAYSLNVESESKLAQKMLLRLSFRKIGAIRRMRQPNGSTHDMALYELIRADINGE